MRDILAHAMIRVQRSPRRRKSRESQTTTRPAFVFVTVRLPTISPAPLTRHSPYRGDKLSRLAPPPELIQYHSFCGIKS
jgi:hypothetical protein